MVLRYLSVFARIMHGDASLCVCARGLFFFCIGGSFFMEICRAVILSSIAHFASGSWRRGRFSVQMPPSPPPPKIRHKWKCFYWTFPFFRPVGRKTARRRRKHNNFLFLFAPRVWLGWPFFSVFWGQDQKLLLDKINNFVSRIGELFSFWGIISPT